MEDVNDGGSIAARFTWEPDLSEEELRQAAETFVLCAEAWPSGAVLEVDVLGESTKVRDLLLGPDGQTPYCEAIYLNGVKIWG